MLTWLMLVWPRYSRLVQAVVRALVVERERES
jgi:hypothetical protein